MSDLEILAELSKAEAKYQLRVDEAKKKADRMVLEDQNQATVMVKQGKDDFKRTREERSINLRKAVQDERKKRYEDGIAQLNKQHPEDNPNLDKAVTWLIESYEGWLALKGG